MRSFFLKTRGMGSISLLSMAFLVSCSPSGLERQGMSTEPDNKNNSFIYSISEIQGGVIHVLDRDRDDLFESRRWIKTEPAQESQETQEKLLEKSAQETEPGSEQSAKGETRPDSMPDTSVIHLYHEELESRKGESVIVRRTYYGPQSIPLVRIEDINKNGVPDMVRYYNMRALQARPGKTTALMQVDSDENGDVEVWIFPGSRQEIDTDGDAKPDRFTTDDNERVTNFFKLSEGKTPGELSGEPLDPAQSWALHPNLAVRADSERYRPILYVDAGAYLGKN